MTTDADGSATAAKPDAGTPGADTGNGAQGSNTGASDPFAGLETGTREWAGTKGYKSVADIAKAAQNAESLIGRSVQIPDDKATPEDREKFYGRLGRPEKPDGYQFKLPEGLPEGLPYDESFATRSKPVAHKLGLTAAQAQGFHDWYVTEQAEAFKAAVAANAKAVDDATTALEPTYGGPHGSEAFKTGVARTNQALAKLGGDELVNALKDEGLLSSEGFVLNPVIAKAFYSASKLLFQEDGLDRGSAAAAGDNPFKDGPAKGNLTAMHRAIKQDRAGAIAMIRAAGREPKEWGLEA